jgi:hypothetical protein
MKIAILSIKYELLSLGLIIFLIGCRSDFSTEIDYNPKVIVVVMDGARYSETWGDSNHTYIPFMADSLLHDGVIYSNFYNQGPTYTLAGHTAITTGVYQEIDNSGRQLPDSASMFQRWAKTWNKDKTKAWIITSKSKLEVLGNTIDSSWVNSYLPETNCGKWGLGVGSENRDDKLTLQNTLEILSAYTPELVLINFMQPDVSGHSGNWNQYTEAITQTDSLIYKLYMFTQQHPAYKNRTYFFVTNDHGRHDDASGGFTSHGDRCEGCRHIFLYASGPRFKKEVVIDSLRQQIDIPATIAYLLKSDFKQTNGKVMSELFQ